MRFQVKLKAKSVWTARKRALIHDAIVYAHCYMGLSTLDEKVIIRLSGDAYVPGLCCNLGDRYLVKISGNQLEEDIVETLFHELHTRSSIRSWLFTRRRRAGKVYWLGHWYYRGDYRDYRYL